jgi:hypothetical protein
LGSVTDIFQAARPNGGIASDVDETGAVQAPENALERDHLKLNRHRALDLWWSMIFSENRYPLFRIML